MRRVIFGALAAATFALGLGAPAATAADKDVIDYRQNLMKTLGAQASSIGAIAQNKVSQADNLAYHADVIAMTADAALAAFRESVPGGTSKADIWDNWDDFEERFTGLAAAAREVSAAAKSGGLAEAGPKMQAMFVCKACHDTYRTE